MADIVHVNPDPVRILSIPQGLLLTPQLFQDIEAHQRIALGRLLVLMANGATAKLVESGAVYLSGNQVIVPGPLVTIRTLVRANGFMGCHYAQLSGDTPVLELGQPAILRHPLPTNVQTRTDVIVLLPALIDDPPTEVQFLSLDAAGNPRPVTQSVVAAKTVSGQLLWLQADANNQVSLAAYPAAVPVCTVTQTQGQPARVENISYAAVTVGQHRDASELDHPVGSVKKRHMDPNLVGANYTVGQHLTLEEASNDIMEARGSTPSIDARIGGVVDEAGNIIASSVQDAVLAILGSLLGGMLDERGNLSPDAVLATGAASRIGVLSGSTSGGSPTGSTGWIPLPPGFSEDECHFFVSPRHISFAIQTNVGVVIDTYSEGRRPTQITLVDREGNTPMQYYGTVNYLVIGIRNS